MTKDVVVTILGRQTIDRETDQTKVVTDAIYYKKNDHHYILYDELPDSGPHTVHNRLKFDDHTLEMSKKGGLTARLLFEPGNVHCSEYGTPMGPMQMQTVTESYMVVEREEQIEVALKYRMYINESVISKHELELTIREKIQEKESDSQ